MIGNEALLDRPSSGCLLSGLHAGSTRSISPGRCRSSSVCLESPPETNAPCNTPHSSSLLVSVLAFRRAEVATNPAIATVKQKSPHHPGAQPLSSVPVQWPLSGLALPTPRFDLLSLRCASLLRGLLCTTQGFCSLLQPGQAAVPGLPVVTLQCLQRSAWSRQSRSDDLKARPFLGFRGTGSHQSSRPCLDGSTLLFMTASPGLYFLGKAVTCGL